MNPAISLQWPGFAAAILAAVLLLAAAPQSLAGSAERGEALSVTCAACHGADGNSVNPQWPSIAGQSQRYLVETLQAYVEGTRSDPLMTGQAMALSEQDMRDLAAFYSTQTRASLAVADPDLVDAGERLYRGGNLETGVAACIACHGPGGNGNPPAGFPVVAGQHASYSAAQLRLYRAGERRSDYEQMMRSIAERMTDREIEAVAAYMQGLH